MGGGTVASRACLKTGTVAETAAGNMTGVTIGNWRRTPWRMLRILVTRGKELRKWVTKSSKGIVAI